MKNKQEEYAVKIISQIQAMFNDPDCDNHIDINDFEDGKNATDFIHALTNMAPTQIYNTLTGEQNSMLDFNHIANKLVFQNSKSVENDK